MVRRKKRTQRDIIMYQAIAAIRKAFTQTDTYRGVKLKARIPYVGENKRRKWSYICGICKEHVPESIRKDGKSVRNVFIDHIDPICEPSKSYYDYTLDELLDRINCDPSNLQVVCKQCHDIKSKKERNAK